TVQRNVAVNAATSRNVNAGASTATASLNVSITGSPMSSETTTNLFTANGTVVSLAELTAAPLKSTALVTAQAAAGDVYDQRVNVEFVTGQPVTVTTATTTPAAVSITAAPTPLGASTTTRMATMPYPTIMSTWPGYAGAVGYTWT